MNSPKPPVTDPQKASELIVAYLDGELSAAGCQELEERLSHDAAFRDQLNSYRRTWDILDELPTTMADDRFAASTIELVAVAASDAEHPASRHWSWIAHRPWAVALLGLCCSFLLGFLIVSAVAAMFGGDESQASRNQQLLQDLPVIERVEIYQAVGDIEFLRALAKSDFLDSLSQSTDNLKKPNQSSAGEPRSQSTEVRFASLSVEDRRGAIESLADFQTRKLQQRRRIFAGLERSTQQQLRELHQAIQDDPQHEQLITVADRYQHWLSQQPSNQQLAIASADVENRLDHVRQLAADRKSRQDRSRSANDLHETVRWLNHFARDHRREIQQRLRRAQQQRSGESKHRGKAWKTLGALGAGNGRLLTIAMVNAWIEDGEPRDPQLTKRAMEHLLESLSPATRREVLKSTGVKNQWHALVTLLEAGYAARLPERKRASWERKTPAERMAEMVQAGHKPPPREISATEERRLWRVYEEELSDQQRQELEHLSREEILERLVEELKPRRPQAGDPRGKPEFRPPRPEFRRPKNNPPERRRGARPGERDNRRGRPFDDEPFDEDGRSDDGDSLGDRGPPPRDADRRAPPPRRKRRPPPERPVRPASPDDSSTSPTTASEDSSS